MFVHVDVLLTVNDLKGHQPDPCQFISMFVINVHLLLQRIVSAQNLNEDDIE